MPPLLDSNRSRRLVGYAMTDIAIRIKSSYDGAGTASRAKDIDALAETRRAQAQARRQRRAMRSPHRAHGGAGDSGAVCRGTKGRALG